MQRNWNEGDEFVCGRFSLTFLCVLFCFLNLTFLFFILVMAEEVERRKGEFCSETAFLTILFDFWIFWVPSLCRDFALEIVLSDAGRPAA